MPTWGLQGKVLPYTRSASPGNQDNAKDPPQETGDSYTCSNDHMARDRAARNHMPRRPENGLWAEGSVVTRVPSHGSWLFLLTIFSYFLCSGCSAIWGLTDCPFQGWSIPKDCKCGRGVCLSYASQPVQRPYSRPPLGSGSYIPAGNNSLP